MYSPPVRTGAWLTSGASITNPALTITFFLLLCSYSQVLFFFFLTSVVALHLYRYCLDPKENGKKKKLFLCYSCLIIGRTLFTFHQSFNRCFIWSWWKPKWVHLDVICIIHTVVFSVQSISIFWKTGWDLRKKRHTQAFQFLQLVVHMYFVPVKLFILEIKEKNLYWKKNCLASQCGLALTRSRVWPLGGVKQFFCLFFV